MAGSPPIDHRADIAKKFEKVFNKRFEEREDKRQYEIDRWFDNSMLGGDIGTHFFISGTLELLSRYPVEKLIGMDINAMTHKDLVEWLRKLTNTERRKVIEQLTNVWAKRNLLKTQLELGYPIKDERKERKEQKGSGLEDPYFGRMTLV